MSRILMCLVAALCVAGNVVNAQQADEEAKDAPRRPAVGEAVPVQTLEQPAARARGTEAVRSQPAEKPWWMDSAQRRLNPPERPRREAPAAGERKRALHRLRNAPAKDVAQAINEMLRAEVSGPAAAMRERVVVVAEPVSNSLLVSGPAKDVEQLGQLVEALDEPPPMVLIQMLVAQSTLADAHPNRPAKPASSAGPQRDEPEVVGLPKGSHFSAERLSREVELGVLGAPSEKRRIEEFLRALRGPGSTPPTGAGKGGVDQELRALRERGHLEVLSRPQLMTISNQPAHIQVGSQEPVVRSSRPGPSGAVHQIDYVNVGLQVGVTPRVEPDGRVTMEIDVEMSQLAPPEQGAVASASPDGPTAVASRIVTITAKSTVSVADGDTVVLGGLTSKSDAREEELLLVLTPRIINPVAERGSPGKAGRGGRGASR